VNEVIVGLGSNLCEPIKQVLLAFEKISQIAECKLVSKSSLYVSSPQGPQDQEDFCNAAVLLETTLTPVQLLQALQTIEVDTGRVKTRHWGERIIDLDIIFFGQQTLSLKEPFLSIPHPQALHRDFVIIPTLEIAPNWLLPDNSPLAIHAAVTNQHLLQKLDTSSVLVSSQTTR